MRIALVATSSGPVCADNTGSVESQVWLLARELVALGHDITVFGCAGHASQRSDPPCEFIATHAGPYATPGTLTDWQLCDIITLSEAVAQSHRFDIIHSHAYLWGLPLERFSSAPMVHTLHTMPYDNELLLWERYPKTRIVGLSRAQWHTAPGQPAATIPNGVDPADFALGAGDGGYICFLGRFIPGKGPLDAIVAARDAEIPIVLAGPPSDYFDREIRHLVDGKHIRYIGTVDRRARSELLGRARALIYPLREPEPFGLVQVEAMMCGTPVAAMNIGAVPEIVEHGRTGFVMDQAADLPSAIHRAGMLDRSAIREHAAGRFSAARMAAEYEALYESIVRNGSGGDKENQGERI